MSKKYYVFAIKIIIIALFMDFIQVKYQLYKIQLYFKIIIIWKINKKIIIIN